MKLELLQNPLTKFISRVAASNGLGKLVDPDDRTKLSEEMKTLDFSIRKAVSSAVIGAEILKSSERLNTPVRIRVK